MSPKVTCDVPVLRSVKAVSVETMAPSRNSTANVLYMVGRIVRSADEGPAKRSVCVDRSMVSACELLVPPSVMPNDRTALLQFAFSSSEL